MGDMSANTPNQPRQPKGVPAGGQWRAQARPEGPPLDEPRQAARDGILSANFDHCDLGSAAGWTVAHTAALHGHLPPGFDRWDLADRDGCTVAHVAAGHGHLRPPIRLPASRPVRGGRPGRLSLV